MLLPHHFEKIASTLLINPLEQDIQNTSEREAEVLEGLKALKTGGLQCLASGLPEWEEDNLAAAEPRQHACPLCGGAIARPESGQGIDEDVWKREDEEYVEGRKRAFDPFGPGRIMTLIGYRDVFICDRTDVELADTIVTDILCWCESESFGGPVSAHDQKPPCVFAVCT